MPSKQKLSAKKTLRLHVITSKEEPAVKKVTDRQVALRSLQLVV
ncbi:hypothetical protein ACTQ33_16535 [Candidatus Avoscillospira sp. LCP25S3_F1]